MRSALKLLLVLLTVITIIFARLTHQLDRPVIQAAILILIVLSVVSFVILNYLDARDERTRRRARESADRKMEVPAKKTDGEAAGKKHTRRSDTSFSLRERKSGLTWGGGNILASEATRGTRRKFLKK